MLLSVPICTPFTTFRGASDVGSTAIASGPQQLQQRQHSSGRFSGAEAWHCKGSGPRVSSGRKAPSCLVFASSSKDATGGSLPTREVCLVQQEQQHA
jgi:hypothetical protein